MRILSTRLFTAGPGTYGWQGAGGSGYDTVPVRTVYKCSETEHMELSQELVFSWCLWGGRRCELNPL